MKNLTLQLGNLPQENFKLRGMKGKFIQIIEPYKWKSDAVSPRIEKTLPIMFLLYPDIHSLKRIEKKLQVNSFHNCDTEIPTKFTNQRPHKSQQKRTNQRPHMMKNHNWVGFWRLSGEKACLQCRDAGPDPPGQDHLN